MDLTLKFIKNGSFCDCGACILDYDQCSTQCGDVGHFEYKKEVPGKIQTEYEWKKERFDLFVGHNTTNIENAEYHQLRNWLKENKPENWVQCTHENTLSGAEVREITTKHTDYGLATVCMFLENNPSVDVVVVYTHNSRHQPDALHNYEININM